MNSYGEEIRIDFLIKKDDVNGRHKLMWCWKRLEAFNSGEFREAFYYIHEYYNWWFGVAITALIDSFYAVNCRQFDNHISPMSTATH